MVCVMLPVCGIFKVKIIGEKFHPFISGKAKSLLGEYLPSRLFFVKLRLIFFISLCPLWFVFNVSSRNLSPTPLRRGEGQKFSSFERNNQAFKASPPRYYGGKGMKAGFLKPSNSR